MKSVMNWAGYEKKAFFSSPMQETVCLSVCPFQSCLGGVLEVSRESLRVLKIKGVLKGVLEREFEIKLKRELEK